MSPFSISTANALDLTISINESHFSYSINFVFSSTDGELEHPARARTRASEAIGRTLIPKAYAHPIKEVYNWIFRSRSGGDLADRKGMGVWSVMPFL